MAGSIEPEQHPNVHLDNCDLTQAGEGRDFLVGCTSIGFLLGLFLDYS